MERTLWSLAIAAAFVVGCFVGGGARKDESTARGALEARDDAGRRAVVASAAPSAPSPSGAPASTGDGSDGSSVRRMDGSSVHRVLSAALTTERAAAAASPRETQPGGPASAWDRGAAGGAARGPGSAPPTVEGALERFRAYVEATSGGDGRDQWRRARELLNDLRAMGEPAAAALMHVLASDGDSDERRAAARLLGTLQVPQSVPLLRDIIDRDDDLLLRRAAAAGLRQLQTPDALPVMERLVANPGEDRFVRLSAAAGLAEANRPLGVSALAQIFEESAADGRGRDLAFRALAGLDDARSLSFMRGLVTAPIEPTYRLRAIKYVTAQGDRQALGPLQAVMSTPGEQPSLRDAATQAYTTLGGK